MLAAALPPAFAAQARIGQTVAKSWVTSLLHRAGVAAVTYPDATRPAVLTQLAADEYPVCGAVQLDFAGVAR